MGCHVPTYYPVSELQIIGGRNYLTSDNTIEKEQRKCLFGFNGQEQDNEVKGNGNSLDFGARGYDPRRGQFLSIDPLSKKFPHESNYSFAGNSPIFYIDNKGERKTVYLTVMNENTGDKMVFEKIVSNELLKVPKVQHLTIFGLYADGRTKETVYDWYDIDINVTITIHNDMSLSKTENSKKGDYRTTTNGPSMYWANKKLDAADAFNSLLNGNTKENDVPAGYVLTSTKGGHSESLYNKGAKYVLGYINVDELLTTLGAANTATGSLSTSANSMLKFAPNASSNLKSFAERLSSIINHTDIGFSLVDALKPENKPQGFKCNQCGKIVNDTSTHTSLGYGYTKEE